MDRRLTMIEELRKIVSELEYVINKRMSEDSGYEAYEDEDANTKEMLEWTIGLLDTPRDRDRVFGDIEQVLPSVRDALEMLTEGTARHATISDVVEILGEMWEAGIEVFNK